MGVAGLWDVLRPAGKMRSLTHLSVKDGFEANPDGKRGFRVGIDASIWFYHATYGREGENPELRTLFFRCTRLMSMPFLPLFVFDGPKRPEVKRGKRISGKNHWMVQGMQEIISAFGFEWRMAPGEAEAELAYLNRIGVIDAVLSDDVDTFLFGAKMLVRNPSTSLSGNNKHSLKNSAGRDDGNHVMTYSSADLLTHEDIQLDQFGLILIGVMRGGDYSDGLQGCGVATAAGLARAGFGEKLVNAARTLSRDALEDFLAEWRQALRHELRTNSTGRLQRKSPSLAKAIPEDFPNIDVLLSYTNPITSESRGPGHKNAVVDWDKEPDLGRIAGLCEMYFEWGIKHIIIKRFRTVLWPSAVLRILRRAALIKDRKTAALARANPQTPQTPRKSGKERRAPPGTPSSMITKHFAKFTISTPSRGDRVDESDEEDEEGERLIVRIHSSRRHPSTDNTLEYRLEIAPAQLVRLCEAGVKGLRQALPPDLSDDDDDGDDDDEEGGGKKRGAKTCKPPPEPDSHLRIWLPACMVEMVEPELVDEYEGIQQKKAEKKAAKGAKGRKAGGNETGTKTKKVKSPVVLEEESGSDLEPPAPKSKATQVAASTSRKQSKAATTGKSNKDKAAVSTGSTGVKDHLASKNKTSGSVRTTRTASNVSKVAELFKQSRPQITAPAFELEESSDDDVPKPSQRSQSASQAFSTASTSSLFQQPLSTNSPPSSSKSSPSRLLSYLDSLSYGTSSKQSASTASSLSNQPKARSIQPFPMDLDALLAEKRTRLPSSDPDDDLFTSNVSAPTKSSSHTRTRSNTSMVTDSDTPSSLKKSPRHSKEHFSPHSSPSKPKAERTPRKEEEEESSDDDYRRSPSPSPRPRRSPRSLGSHNIANVLSSPKYARMEEEESDRAVSPSPMRQKAQAGPSRQTAASTRQTFIRKPPPLPTNVSIISISSDSESDEDEDLPASILPPLQRAKARLISKDVPPPIAKSSQPKPPTAAARSLRAPRDYDPDDIIDLT